MLDYSGQLTKIMERLIQIKKGLSQNSFYVLSAVAAIGSFIAALAGLWAARSAYRTTKNLQRIARFYNLPIVGSQML